MADTRTSPTKATLTVTKPKTGGSAEEIFTLSFPFNPKEWSITHAAEWKVETTKKSAPPPEFKGPKPSSASVEIFLDESDKDGGDISKTVDKLRQMVVPEPSTVTKGKPSAPHVLFQWGDRITFKGYVESIAVKFTMFRAEGTPIRGTCTLAMKEFPLNPKKQNPSSGGELGHRSHRFVTGDTLASLSYGEYGDPTAWRRIAAANEIDDPLRIRPGTVLRIPPP
jgi:nucleoid-associated protein YgaU